MVCECWVRVSERHAVRLSAFRFSTEPEGWKWHVTDPDNEADLYTGSALTLMSAQVAAQLALDQWLHEKRIQIAKKIYDWYPVRAWHES